MSLYLSQVRIGHSGNARHQLDDALIYFGWGEVIQVRDDDGCVEAWDHIPVRIEYEAHPRVPVVIAGVVLGYGIQADVVDEEVSHNPGGEVPATLYLIGLFTLPVIVSLRM